MRTFKDYCVWREAIQQTPTVAANSNMQANSTQTSQNAVKSLQGLMKTPAPAGINPNSYKQTINKAITVSRTGNLSADQALDTVRLQNKAIGPQS